MNHIELDRFEIKENFMPARKEKNVFITNILQ